MPSITAALLAAACSIAAATQPHLIHILMDDVGHNDLGFANPKVLTAPHCRPCYRFQACRLTRSSVSQRDVAQWNSGGWRYDPLPGSELPCARAHRSDPRPAFSPSPLPSPGDYHHPSPPPSPKKVRTPTIDGLAASGVTLDHFYTFKECAPSRGSLLSGRYPFHFGYCA